MKLLVQLKNRCSNILFLQISEVLLQVYLLRLLYYLSVVLLPFLFFPLLMASISILLD